MPFSFFLLHAAPVLAADFVQRRADLAERAALDRIDQHGEDVAVLDHRLLELLQHGRRLVGIAGVEVAQALDLRLLFLVGRARQFDFLLGHALRIEEGIDADDRVGAVVLLVLVIHRLFLDLAALVAGFHGAEHAAATGDGFEFLQHGFFDQVGQFVDDEGALVGVLARFPRSAS